MTGPGGHPRDLESGVAQATTEASAADSLRAASEKIRSSTDGRATSTAPSSTHNPTGPAQNAAQCSNKVTDAPLLHKWQGSIPPTVQRHARRLGTYLKGPEPPQIWKIRPVLPRLQHLPLRLVDRVCPKQWQRILALIVFYVVWVATFGAVLHKSSVAGDVNDYGQPIRVACGGVFWYAFPSPPPLWVDIEGFSPVAILPDLKGN